MQNVNKIKMLKFGVTNSTGNVNNCTNLTDDELEQFYEQWYAEQNQKNTRRKYLYYCPNNFLLHFRAASIQLRTNNNI